MAGQGVSLLACLFVHSEPTEANVMVNGIPFGTTPIENLWLPYGEIGLVISKKGHDVQKQNLYLVPGEVHNIKTQLIVKPSLLTIDGEPRGADIYINGKKFGSIPLKDKNIKPGNYDLKIKANCYEEHIQNLKIFSGKKKNLKIKLNVKNKIELIKNIDDLNNIIKLSIDDIMDYNDELNNLELFDEFEDVDLKYIDNLECNELSDEEFKLLYKNLPD